MSSKIASLYAEIGADTTGLKKGLDESKGGLNNFAKSFKEVTGISLGFASAAAAVGAVLGTVKKVMEEAVNETVRYAEQVRDLGRISGTSSEQTSRLIQTADDLKVSYETLTMAARTAAQKGIALTTDALAKLSDEYLKLPSAADRSKFALDNFGRAGLEMTKILEMGGDALRKMAKEQNSNLILTDQQVRAARNYEIAQDNLQDSVNALKYSLGNGLLPVLIKVVDAFNSLIVGGERTRNEINGIISGQVALGGSLSEVNARIKDQLISAGYLVGNYDEIRLKGGQVVEGAHLLTEAEYGVAAAFAENNRQLELAPPRFDDYSLSAQAAEQATKSTTDTLWAMNGAMGEINSQMLFKRLAEGLSGSSQLSLARAMGLIDENKYAFLSAIENIKQGMKDTALDATNAGLMVFDLFLKLKQYDGMDVSAHIKTFHEIETTYTGNPPPWWTNPSALPSPIDPGGGGMASGGSFVIPPGYPNDSYPLGAGHWGQSGETVTVTPAGQSAPQSSITQNFYVNDKLDLELVAARVAREIQRRQ